ncbi:MAG: DUF4221 family protein [Saprospiraceae bacterium]|nr:DUF4221 family protein [Saprospiraceae bacterium]
MYEVIDSFTIKLDSLTPLEENQLFIRNDKLIILNFINKSIDYYNLNSGNLINRCQIFSKENKYNKIASGILKNDKFVILINPNLNNSFILDDSCNIIEKQIIYNSYEYSDEINGIINTDNGSYGGPMLIGNYLYFLNGPFLDPNSNWELRKSYNYERKYSFINKRLTSIPVCQPNTYKSGVNLNNYNLMPFRAFNGDSNLFVYSWPSTNILTTFNIESEEIKYCPIINSNICVTNNTSTKEGEIETALNSIMFGPILYDSIKKVYYRFILNKYIPKNIIHPEYLNLYSKPVSIQVLNSNFESIGIINISKPYFFTKSILLNGYLYLVRFRLDEDHMFLEKINVLL